MKTFALVAVLLSSTAFGDPVCPAGASCSIVNGGLIVSDPPVLKFVDPVTAGMPMVSPEIVIPIVVLPDGSLAVGRSQRVARGAIVPYSGQLLDDQEHTRREGINERNRVELEDLKRGNLIVSAPVAVAIAVGIFVVSAAATTGIVLAATR